MWVTRSEDGLKRRPGFPPEGPPRKGQSLGERSRSGVPFNRSTPYSNRSYAVWRVTRRRGRSLESRPLTPSPDATRAASGKPATHMKVDRTRKGIMKTTDLSYCGVDCKLCDVFRATVHGDGEALRRAHKLWTKTAQKH